MYSIRVFIVMSLFDRNWNVRFVHIVCMLVRLYVFIV